MNDITISPEEGLYKDKHGKIYCITNLQELDDLVLFDLVESDDPEDMSAIATELTSEEWPYTCEELGLVKIEMN